MTTTKEKSITMSAVTPKRALFLICALVCVAIILWGRISRSDAADAPAPSPTGSSAPAEANPAAPGTATDEVALPITKAESANIVGVALRVASVVGDPSLSAEQQNEQTADLSIGKLVPQPHPVTPATGSATGVRVERFEYMSAEQVQVRVTVGSDILFLTFEPTAGGWKVSDVTSNGCASGAACPFDPTPLPPITGTDQ